MIDLHKYILYLFAAACMGAGFGFGVIWSWLESFASKAWQDRVDLNMAHARTEAQRVQAAFLQAQAALANANSYPNLTPPEAFEEAVTSVSTTNPNIKR